MKNIVIVTLFVVIFLFSIMCAHSAPSHPLIGLDNGPYTPSLNKLLDQVPLSRNGIFPVVEARINGQGPFSAELDTGMTNCMVSSKIAKILHLQSSGKDISVNAANTSSWEADYKLKSLTIGKVSIPIAHTSIGSVSDVDIVIGCCFLDNYIVKFNFRENMLEIYSSATYSVTNTHIIPIVVDKFSDLAIFSGEIGGMYTTMTFDSGAGPAVLVSGGALKTRISAQFPKVDSVNYLTYGGFGVADEYNVPEVQIGDDGYKLWSNILATIIKDSPNSPIGVGASLNFLRFFDSSITFDYPGHCIFIDEPPMQ